MIWNSCAGSDIQYYSLKHGQLVAVVCFLFNALFNCSNSIKEFYGMFNGKDQLLP